MLAHDLANRPKYKRFSGADVAGLCQRAVDFTIQAQIAAEDRGEVVENVITAETLERAYKYVRLLWHNARERWMLTRWR